MTSEVALRCAADDGRTAVDVCVVCDRPACRECAGDEAEGEFRCRDCAYAIALGQVDEQHALRAAAADVEAEGPGALRTYGARIALVAAVVVLCGWTGPGVAATLAKARPYAIGPVGDPGEATDLDDAVRALWQVRGGLQVYAAANEGRVPSSLSELTDVPTSCGGCGGTWAFERTSEHSYRIACPAPRRHDRTGVFLNDVVGPPQVTLDDTGGGR